LGQGDQNWDFNVKNGGFFERKTQKQGGLFWSNSSVELELTRASCPITAPLVLGVPGIGGSIRTVQTDSFDVINCI